MIRFYLQSRPRCVAIETGWAITAHAVGLGRPMDEHLQTTGKAVPGYHGKKKTVVTCHAFVKEYNLLSAQ